MLEEVGGQTLMGRPIDRVVFDESGSFLETFGPKLYTRDARKGVQEK